MHETYRREKRETPEHELDQFHKRWFSATVGDWLDKIRQVDVEFDATHHSINVGLSPDNATRSIAGPR